MKGLIIDRPWIDKIINGAKVWEMRSRPTKVRGDIALIAKGTGTIVAFARLVDCLPAMSPEQLTSHFAKHRIPPEMTRQPGYKWFTPWVLEDIRRVNPPLPYDHPSGAVTWVNLRDNQHTGKARTPLPAHPAARAANTQCGDQRLANRVLSQISREHGIDVPADASTLIRRSGSKLYIDVEWDDISPARKTGWWRFRNTIGVLGVAASIVCAAGLMIHFPLAILTSSFTIFGALKWIRLLFAAMIVAVLGGRGSDLEQLFGGR